MKIEGTVRKAVAAAAAAALLRPCTEGRGGVEGSRELLIQQNTEGASERERESEGLGDGSCSVVPRFAAAEGES